MSGKFLADVLAQTERIHTLIDQSAKELSSKDSGRKLDLANGAARSAASKAVAGKLLDASQELTAVIQSLRIAIRDRILVDHLLAAAEEQEAGARSASLHDSLTGLPNRVLLKDRLEHGIAQAKRHRWILALMFIDLDNFKAVNDTYGHQAGDSVLQTIAARLRQITREDDTVSRYGGDEFLYLLSQIHDERDIAMIAAKILTAIQAPCIVNVPGVIASASVTASIGVAVYPRDGTTASALIRSADEAMYGAKLNNTGCVFARIDSAPLCATSHRSLGEVGIVSMDAP